MKNRLESNHTENSILDMMNMVKQLATSEGRMVGTKGHKKALDLLVTVLSDGKNQLGNIIPFDEHNYVLTSVKNGTWLKNIVGVQRNGGKQNPILIGAHYDTCGITPGADDNAAAISIILNVVKKLRLSTQHLKRDLIVAFFDAEEPPHFLSQTMGSTRFYEDYLKNPIDFAIILDLVGHDVPLPGLEPLIAVTGIESHPQVEQLILSTPVSKNLKVIPTLNRYVGDMSDHYIFRKYNVPYLFLSCGHWPHYHQVTDTPEKLNYDKMESIAQYLTNLIFITNDMNFLPVPELHDTLGTEIKFVRHSLGDYLNTHKLPEPHNRDELNTMITRLLKLGI